MLREARPVRAGAPPPHVWSVARARLADLTARTEKENEWAPTNAGGSNVIFFSQFCSHGEKSLRFRLGASHVFLRRWSQALCTGATAV